MPAATALPSTLPSTPAAVDAGLPPAQWLAASRRLVAGRPDTRYGWWEAPDAAGPAVVKALAASLTAAASTLLHHEKDMLGRLRQLGAPVPDPLMAAMRRYPSCVITRFGGLSLRTLQARQQKGLSALNLRERLSVWAHLARRLHPLASQHGLLVADLWEGNVLVPLMQVHRGQLRLNQPLVVDHAHTLLPGSALQRPLWIDETQARIAPELAEALRADREALERHFAVQGAALPGYSRLPGELDRRSREAWLSYRAPSALQRALDGGQLDAGAAMQYAVGVALQQELARARPEELAPFNLRDLQTLQHRLCRAQPSERLGSLAAVAEALGEVLGGLSLASVACLAPITPGDLLLEPISMAQPSADPTCEAGSVAACSPGAEPVCGLTLGWLLGAAALGSLLAGVLA
jgi:hypothetical protein